MVMVHNELNVASSRIIYPYFFFSMIYDLYHTRKYPQYLSARQSQNKSCNSVQLQGFNSVDHERIIVAT